MSDAVPRAVIGTVLALDAGNTSISLGLFTGGKLTGRARIHTRREITPAALSREAGRLLCDAGRPDTVAVCSVVPPIDTALRTFAESLAKDRVVFVTQAAHVPMPVRYNPPESLGADRIVNAYAAWHLLHRACIVVDLGTATKFDAVGVDGTYLGGAIAPGASVSSRALTEAAAKLPRVDMLAPPSAIGTSTAQALSSGLVFGHAAMIDGMVRRFRAEMGADAAVIATGGLAPVICPQTDTAQSVEPALTLRGLEMLARG